MEFCLEKNHTMQSPLKKNLQWKQSKSKQEETREESHSKEETKNR